MTQARVTWSQARPSSEGLRASLFSLQVRVCPMPLLQQCWDHGRMRGAASRSLYGASPRLNLWVCEWHWSSSSFLKTQTSPARHHRLQVSFLLSSVHLSSFLISPCFLPPIFLLKGTRICQPQICHFWRLIVLSCRHLKNSQSNERLSLNTPICLKTNAPKGAQLL